MDLSQLGFMGNFNSRNSLPSLSGGLPGLGTPGTASLAGNGLGSSPLRTPGLGAGFTTQNFDSSPAASQAGRQPTYGSQMGAGGWATDPAQLDYFKTAAPNPTSGNIPSYLQNMPGMMQTLSQNPSVAGHEEQVADPWGTFNGLGSDLAKYQWFNNHPQYQNVIRGNMGTGFAPWYSNIDSNGGATQASVNTGSTQPSYQQNPATLASLGSTPGVTPPAGSTAQLPGADPNDISVPSLAGQFSATKGPLSSVPSSSNPNTNALMDVYADPSYQFRLDQGLKSVGNAYGARGDFLSGAAAKALNNYGQNAASQEYGAAYGRMTGDRQYNYDVAQGDRTQSNLDRNFNYGVASDDRATQLAQANTNRNFNYNAALTDQTVPFNQQMSLAQLGLGATGSSAQNNAALAAILSANTTGAGNAGAAGTVGSSNAWNSMISQMFNNYLQQNFINRLPGLKGS